MGLGVSLVLSAIGAVLIWAVNAQVSGVNIHTIGWILFIVGLAGFLLSLAFLDSWRSRRTVARRHARYDDTYDEDVAP